MRTQISVVILILLVCSSLAAEVMTQTGALNLAKEGESIAQTLYSSVSTRSLNNQTDRQARRELLGLCENLLLLRGDLEAGIVAPRAKLLLVRRSHDAFLPIHQHLPLEQSERASVTRLLSILDALTGYHKQVGGKVANQTTPPVTPPPVTPPPVTPPPVAPVTNLSQGNWQSTPYPWCQIQGQVKVEGGTPPVPLPSSLQSHTDAVKISGSLSGLRLRPSNPIADPSRVALAFLDEGTGVWTVHQADFDPNTGWVESDPNHCSWWRVVTTPFARFKKKSAHFNIHFFGRDDSTANVQTNLNSLEAARSRLQNLGLHFPKSTLDVYYRELSPDISARHSLGKAAGSWMELNLPSRSKDSALGRKGTMGHELFHEIHAYYEHHLALGANATIAVNGKRHAYQWLNEALSSWFEFDFIKSAGYQGNLYPYTSGFHLKGLQSLSADDGYGGALFIDYVVKLHGREFIGALMRRIQERGGPRVGGSPLRSALGALGDAIFDRGRHGDLKYSDVDGVWEGYVDELMAPKPTAEPRIRRRRALPIKIRKGLANVQTPITFRQAPLSVGPAQMLVVPREAANPEGVVGVQVRLKTQASFPAFTRVYLADEGQPKQNSVLPQSASLLATLDAKIPGTQGQIQFEPKDRNIILFLLPYALKGKGGGVPVTSKLEVKLIQPVLATKEEESVKTTSTKAYNPRVSGVSPKNGRVLDTVTVRGGGFGPKPPGKPTLNSGNCVIFITDITGRKAHIAAPVVRWTNSSITVKVPPANYSFLDYDPEGKLVENVGVAVSRGRKMSNVRPFTILR